MRFLARHEGEAVAVEVERHGAGYRVRIGEREIEADLVAAGESLHVLRFPGGRQYLFLTDRDGSETRITMAGRRVHLQIEDPLSAKRFRREDESHGESEVCALMPGRVVRLLVAQGAEVTKGQGLLILEAMKMENEVAAPKAGIVAQIHVEEGATVERGAALIAIE